jgi:hypothetical protein
MMPAAFRARGGTPSNGKACNMNNPQLGLRVAGTLFGLAGLAHLSRLVLQFKVELCGCVVPLWANLLGLVVMGLLCAWLWKLSLPAKPIAPPPAAA